MKKSLMFVFTVLCVVAFSGIIIAEEINDKRAAAQKRVKAVEAEQAKGAVRVAPSRTTARRPGAGRPADRAEMIKQRTQIMEREFAKEKESHKSFVAKLAAIRKIAKSEKASKTVAELDKLIAETNSKFDEKVKAQKERIRRYSEAIKRGPTSRPRPAQGPQRSPRGTGAEKKGGKVKDKK